jgi:predicted amidohydrolase YtcJ
VTAPDDLLVRNVEVDGRVALDVQLVGGVVAEIGAGLKGRGAEIDGAGGALIPGLIDHHIHLFGLAAQAASVRLEPEVVSSEAALGNALRAKDAVLPPGDWLRGIGYHEGLAGPLDRFDLDRMLAARPVRIQHRTGGLWVLNSAGLARVLPPGDWPACVERDADGVATGRIWRGDDWLRSRLGDAPPSLAAVSADLARYGVVGVTDASVTNDTAQAAVFARAIEGGALVQRLMLMSGGAMEPSPDDAFRVGPVKVLLDDDNLPDLDEVARTIAVAHQWGRAVAIHCVTAGELAFALAAFAQAGARAGDRIEHGGVVHPDAAARIAELRLTVVTQPSFVAERGDRYLAEVDPSDTPYLYPCASLLAAGVRVAGSSDAPYASPDPWASIATAVSRTTRSGQPLGLAERIDPRLALALFLGDFDDPGGPPRRVAVGAPADLCLLRAPLEAALARPDAANVAATIIGGRMVYDGR